MGNLCYDISGQCCHALPVRVLTRTQRQDIQDGDKLRGVVIAN
jgi:hypothetical protein